MRPPPRIPDLLRPLVRATVNRHQLRTAGEPGARAALIRHRGRRSGRTYATPVTPAATADGFVIALPFGDRADWVRNVLAAGEATLVHEGVEHAVRDPVVVPMAEVAGVFSAGDQRVHRRFGVDVCLRLSTTP